MNHVFVRLEMMSFERVEAFCYRGDMMSSDGRYDHAASARANKAWNIFREIKSFLCAKIISLNVKGKIYGACVRN